VPIAAKRDGQTVDAPDIERLVAEYAGGALGDGPMAAFLMAVVLQGMDARETLALTRAMVDSGSTVALGDLGRPVVDKHSTGGVADAVSLVYAPLVASLGLACVKLSGRGLGYTGGTIDKLEAIPGFRVDLSVEQMRRQASQVGCVIAAQSPDVVPADGMIYALRDATATVASVPLIAASVMAKKLAVHGDLILLDVKAGTGAFMRDEASATALATACLAIARQQGRRATAAISDMSQPLGTSVGNALEVAEAIDVLADRRPGRLADLALQLAARSLSVLTGATPTDADEAAHRALRDGTALAAFGDLIRAQGGDPRVIDDAAAILPAAPVRIPIVAEHGGFVARVDAEAIGTAATVLGAGRHRKGAPIDPAVGIVLGVRVGDEVAAGEAIGEIHSRTPEAATAAAAAVRTALLFASEPAETPPLIYGWLATEAA
jgi:pyrimidine-nucleoside phosphorylase